MPTTFITGERQSGAHEQCARDRLYLSLIGVTSLLILLQGLWAGLFIREGKDFDASSSQSAFVTVHDWGGRAAIVFAFISLAVLLWRLRDRRDLVIGNTVLFIGLLLEAYLGGGIGDHPSWPTFHVPLAMILLALTVWLPVRASGFRLSRPGTV